MFLFAKPKILLFSVGILFLAGCNKGDGQTNSKAIASSADLKTEIEKVSYILGYSTGKSLGDQKVDVSADLFSRGMMDGLNKDTNKKPIFTEPQMRETMQAFRTTLREQKQKEREVTGAKNLEENQKFFASNKDKPGVVTLPSGLQYKVITQGAGPKPMPEDTVVVEYVGTLLDGKEFDSTKTRGQPATIPVNSPMKGMSEALKMMPVGSKWELYVPADLGYGANGAGAMIAPNQALKFEIQLLSIKEKVAKPAAEVAPATTVKPESKPSVKAEKPKS